MDSLAYLLGGVLGTMLDPLVAGAGIASYFIGRSWSGWVATAASILAFGVALFLLPLMFADANIMVRIERLLLLLLAIGLWAAVSYGMGLRYSLDRTRQKP